MRHEGIAIEVLTFEGCPHAEAALDLVRGVRDRLAPTAALEQISVETPEKAAAERFMGSPTIRVNGRDIEDRTTKVGALSCRTYDGAGVPPEWMLEAAIVRAMMPGGILFLCVANSARSQLAEGIARSLNRPGMKVWSAGSRPTRVRAEAIAVMNEKGIDISNQYSKDVSAIPADGVDLVVTLCAEEECPVFLGKARRLSWGLPDPAAATGSEAERLDSFRRVRDELERRLMILL